jgi:hypothetical protein
MEVRDIRPDEVEQARALLEANDWGSRVADPAVFRELLARSKSQSSLWSTAALSASFVHSPTVCSTATSPWSLSPRSIGVPVSAQLSSALAWAAT